MRKTRLFPDGMAKGPSDPERKSKSGVPKEEMLSVSGHSESAFGRI